ncbi:MULTISPECIES: hypothetical protein [Gardnerella]|uniref:DUF3168 domain-containing protein n=2 Tax=Gardnerella TaxID=2701 RepID=A0ABM6GJB0_9BIFI|nr:hypothetical protein [Gardnerella vaginalis]APW18783.1 hypothetical protein BVL65_04295 [Gardnerella vaginalis]EPI45854.1 hypothetical protein HMPREF1581_01253 [Gardnerella vaginalis JCP8108]
MGNLLNIMREIGFPFAYHHFAEGESPNPPFLLFLTPASSNFSADGKAYFKANEVHIELYADYKNPVLEEQVEAVLDRHGIFYNKTEAFIESEQLYETLYIFEMEVTINGKQG